MYIHILQMLIKVYMVSNTFEIIFKGTVSACIPVTHPEMRDHINHMIRKTEVTTIQHKDEPCGWEGLKMEKWMETSYGRM